MTENTPKTHKTIPTKQAIYLILAFGLLASSLFMFFVDKDLFNPLEANLLNYYRIIVIVLGLVFLLLASKQTWLNDKSHKLTNHPRLKWLAILIPLSVVLVTILQLTIPEFAVNLVRKESWPFYRNAIFVKSALQLFALVTFIFIARYYWRQKNKLGVCFAIIIAFILMVMAGEELSWGQRIFGWSSPQFIADINTQGETNLHNISTQLFQNVLYFGGWLLLIGLAFWNKSISKLFNKSTKLSFLTQWMPPASFALIFAASFAICDSVKSDIGIQYTSNLFIVLATLLIVIALAISRYHQLGWAGIKWPIAILVIFLLAVTSSLFFNNIWDISVGAFTEYLETYISFGIVIWSVTIRKRLASSTSD